MNVFSKFSKKNVFSKLDEDIITFHILPHLDGKTLIILSSVSSQFHNLIWKNINNNSDLWLNICTSKWPSLLTTFPEADFLSEVISMLPGGYRSFFCDAFSSIHPPLNNPSPPPPLRRPKTFFFYAVDIFLHGEQKPLYSLHTVKLIDTSEYVPPILFENYVPPIFEFELHHGKAELNFIKVKKEGCLEYLKEKLTFSCVAIDPLGIERAGSLFTYGCKAVSAKPVTLGMTSRVKVLFETVLPVPETLPKFI
ncbi:hypothetical protein TSUD_354080 [Trifolium subterraneum]|uniref:F-box domain-containing protein n=1 Tax=Trifolium subterraneum TaxID=3900 RepID=A0A2Z6M2W2_TRISU|nr:hypothetical protein TSUD_354080 [Trifolium subterraneum]